MSNEIKNTKLISLLKELEHAINKQNDDSVNRVPVEAVDAAADANPKRSPASPVRSAESPARAARPSADVAADAAAN